MDMLIWIGAGVTLVGLAGLVYSMVAVARARREGLDDEAMRDRLRRVIPINMGSLFLSFIGLMMVVVGIILG